MWGQEKHGHKKQTNKGQASVIKSSLVLVVYRNAAEPFVTDRGPKPGAGTEPRSLQQSPFTHKPSVVPPQLARTG